METKISICFENEESFSKIASMITKIRLEKNEKQIKLARYMAWISFFVLFLSVVIMDHGKVNFYLIFLPLILFSAISVFIYTFSFLSSIITIKRVRRDLSKNFEILLSKSRYCFVTITVKEYKDFLIKEIKKEQSELKKLISEKNLKILGLKKGLLLFDEYDCKQDSVLLAEEIYNKEISELKEEILLINSAKSEYSEILRQIIE